MGFAACDLHGALGHAVEQIAIVGHEQHCAWVLVHQILLEPLHGVGIQVVRGLVQHREIRSRHEDGRQRHAPLLAAAQCRDARVRAPNAEMVEHGSDTVALLEATQALDLVRRGRLLPEQGVLLAVSPSQPLAELGVPLEGMRPRAQALRHGFGGRRIPVEPGNLRQVTHRRSAASGDRPRVRRVHASDDPRERRLARAVLSDHAHSLARGDGQVRRAHHDVGSEGLVDRCDRDDGHGG